MYDWLQLVAGMLQGSYLGPHSHLLFWLTCCGLVAWLINMSSTRRWRKYWESRRTAVCSHRRARPAVKWRG